ncbi:hypothetical protein MKW92_041481 [Papaver armeniacum]|nr:hypothetical protein MKW92_041481 [Papaver armeniacum]
MDLLSLTIGITVAVFLLLIISFSSLVFIIFTGKSLRNPQYPPVTGTVFDQLIYFKRLYDYQTNIARKHRTFRLLAPDMSEVYTTDPRNIEHGDHNKEIVRDLFGHGIFAVDGDMWRQQRKLASFEFSTRILRDFSCTTFRKNAAKLAGAISELMRTDQTFNIQVRFTYEVHFGFHIQSWIWGGFELLGREEQGSQSVHEGLDDANELTYWRYCDLFWKLKRSFNIGSEATLKKNIKIVDNFVYEVIQNKRELLSIEGYINEKEDILSRFLMASEKDPEKMTDKYLRDIILSFMIAGKDTSANTLSWFFYMICKHPLIQEKVVAEIRDVMDFNEKQTKIADFTMNLTDTILDKMNYLHAALTETLRLYPAVPVDGKCAEKDDVLPDGYKLKKGDGIYYIAYTMGRMTYIWGEDAEDFRPERWLNNGVFTPESPFKFVSFHGGPRICLGKDFAYRQMKIIAMVLLYFFKFKLEDENKQVTYRTMLTLHMKGGLHLNAFSRV